MYYNGKKEFYIKQYGLPILGITFSAMLVIMGVFVYFKTGANITPNKEVIIASNELKNVSTLPNELAKLNPLQKSDKILVKEITDNANIVFSMNNNDVEISLLGIDNEKNIDSMVEKMNNDLLNKEVTLSFENEKVIDNRIYAYVYINNRLYNEKLVENGVAVINKNLKNLTYKNDLIQAQAYAKQLAKGVWKR